MDSSPAALVTAAFAEHDVPVSSEEIDSILEDKDVASWVLEHLSHDTLLSKEELAL